MKNLRDEELRFPQLIHYYSDFIFFFLKRYYKELNNEMTVLDAGCGHGRNLKLLYSLGFKNITGIDIVKRQNFKICNYHELDLAKDKIIGKYDIVLCNFVLMFIDTKYQLSVIDKLINTTNKYLLIETSHLDGQYSYTCYIQNFYNYILGARKDVQIIYYNKSKERLIIKKWQSNQTDISDK
ncbi:class I SAM-dependent methyltransferase [Sedimentibacter sp. zth1]|uniref:class I SAM-dependent methyltransferase n=1 Tax=Sedimentibacter sp. zth1 TaxID=2816908 RepID=UPI001A92BD30|nr:class I SAM-dependent methyltransferase [Sedimentibacter sp. zth1]QSX05427.1 class I SAM-dependent methyltransferase [Sedimentibacter sp. zth1]